MNYFIVATNQEDEFTKDEEFFWYFSKSKLEKFNVCFQHEDLILSGLIWAQNLLIYLSRSFIPFKNIFCVNFKDCMQKGNLQKDGFEKGKNKTEFFREKTQFHQKIPDCLLITSKFGCKWGLLELYNPNRNFWIEELGFLSHLMTLEKISKHIFGNEKLPHEEISRDFDSKLMNIVTKNHLISHFIDFNSLER